MRRVLTSGSKKFKHVYNKKKSGDYPHDDYYYDTTYIPELYFKFSIEFFVLLFFTDVFNSILNMYVVYIPFIF